jgi:hypothetical protein
MLIMWLVFKSVGGASGWGGVAATEGRAAALTSVDATELGIGGATELPTGAGSGLLRRLVVGVQSRTLVSTGESAELGIGAATELPGSPWIRLIRTGTRVRKVGDVYVKEVDPERWGPFQWYGSVGLRAQANALARLDDIAPEFGFDGAQLAVRDAGNFTGSRFSAEYWRTWWEVTRRLGPINFIKDIQPRNMGADGLVFDPVLNPVDLSFAWTGSIATGTFLGLQMGGSDRGGK